MYQYQVFLLFVISIIVFFISIKPLNKSKEFQINQFAQTIGEELVSILDQAYLKELDLTSEQREFNKIHQEISRLYLKEKMHQVTEKISQAEKSSDVPTKFCNPSEYI